MMSGIRRGEMKTEDVGALIGGILVWFGVLGTIVLGVKLAEWLF